MQTRLALVAFLCIVALLLGCGTAKKVNECNALISRINTAEQENSALRATMEKQAPTPEAVAQMAEVFEKLAQDLTAMEISTDELRGYRDDYQQRSVKAGQAMRKLAKAIKDTDHEAHEQAKQESKAAMESENELVEKINKFCTRPD